MKGVQLFISNKCVGLVEALGEHYPDAYWQCCTLHFCRNVFTRGPRARDGEVAAMLKAIHAQEDRQASLQRAALAVEKLKAMNLSPAAKTVEQGIAETLAYTEFPREHWRNMQTDNPMQRVLREIRRRTRVVGSLPDGNSALMLVTARLRSTPSKKWATP